MGKSMGGGKGNMKMKSPVKSLMGGMKLGGKKGRKI